VQGSRSLPSQKRSDDRKRDRNGKPQWLWNPARRDIAIAHPQKPVDSDLDAEAAKKDKPSYECADHSNDAAHRPRAEDVKYETEAASLDSVHLLCSASTCSFLNNLKRRLRAQPAVIHNHHPILFPVPLADAGFK
jgi:hypothetical protein